jgi:hypothetical protein
LSIAGGGIALVGLVLLVLEVARTTSSNTLGSTGTLLLWIGLGLFAVGSILLTLAVARDARPAEAPDAALEGSASDG